MLWLKSRLMKWTPPTGPITVAELLVEEKMILSLTEDQMFGAELTSLWSCERVRRMSPIFKLCPSLLDALLAVGGRLKHASILSALKNPNILPRDHYGSRMIVQEYYENTYLGVKCAIYKRPYTLTVSSRLLHMRSSPSCTLDFFTDDDRWYIAHCDVQSWKYG